MKRLKELLKASKVRKQLNALTDRELNDIGITRGDIYLASRGKL